MASTELVIQLFRNSCYPYMVSFQAKKPHELRKAVVAFGQCHDHKDMEANKRT